MEPPHEPHLPPYRPDHAKRTFSRGPSDHLTWAELACRDGTAYPMAWRDTRGAELAHVFEAIRAVWNKPIRVVSAYRTDRYNRKVGGAPHSQHLLGRALDLRPPAGVPMREFVQTVTRLAREGEIKIGGLGLYKTFIHVDTRPGTLVTWIGTKGTAA